MQAAALLYIKYFYIKNAKNSSDINLCLIKSDASNAARIEIESILAFGHCVERLHHNYEPTFRVTPKEMH